MSYTEQEAGLVLWRLTHLLETQENLPALRQAAGNPEVQAALRQLLQPAVQGPQ